MIKDHSCLSDRERESKESFRFLLVREFERITHQLSTRKALLITMEGLRQRSEVLKQKCERVQEVLLEMKTRTKSYYENQCKSTTDPTLLVPHWYQSSSAEYATMLRIHKKETFDYACINEALQKIEEAERQMNILEIESETLKWFQDQLSPLQPMLHDKCPTILLSTIILDNLDYAEEVNNEVEKSYNKGVWNRNEQAKQQKMEAVVMKKEDSIDGDKKDKKIWSPKTWMKKIFLKKRSQSRDSFFESQEEVSAVKIDDYTIVLRCICYSCSSLKLGR